MRRTLLALSTGLFFVFSTMAARAQTGSVILRDGSNTQISTHATISAAYAAIPATVTQAYAIELGLAYNGVLETFPITLGQKGGTSAAARITIRPAAGAGVKSIDAPTGTAAGLVLDGADWVTVDGTAAGGTYGIQVLSGSSAPLFPLIELKNGATNNTFRFVALFNGVNMGSGDGLVIGSTNAGGNLNNTIDRCSATFLRDAVVISTSAMQGSHTRILGSTFSGIGRSGVRAIDGVSTLEVDSNTFSFLPNSNTDASGIVVESFQDSVRVTRNRVRMDRYTLTQSLTGIRIRSAAISDAAYAFVANNAVFTTETIFPNSPPAQLFGADSLKALTGIEVEGAGVTTAQVCHNTVALRGIMTGSTTALEASAGVRIAGNGPGSSYTMRSNIVVNERSGGLGAQHTVLVLSQTGGTVSSNYNTYFMTAAAMAIVGGTPYATFANYQAAVGPVNEQASVRITAPFSSPNSAALGAAAYNNTDFTAPINPLVPRDYEGELRTVTYRGADELVPTCNASTGGGTAVVTQASPVCSSGYVYLTYNTAMPQRPGTAYQWQRRLLGSTGGWTNIPGATQAFVLEGVTQSTEFRVRDSCVLGGAAAVSVPDTAIVTQFIELSGLTRVDNGLQQTFIAGFTSGGATSYAWNFGNGLTATTAVPTVSHTYAVQGVYTATVIATNDCGSDTATLLFVVGLTPNGVATLNAAEATVSLSPNPAAGAVRVQAGAGMEEVLLLDPTGRVLRRYAVRGGRDEVLALPAGLPAGVYAVRIGWKDGGSVVQRLAVR